MKKLGILLLTVIFSVVVMGCEKTTITTRAEDDESFYLNNYLLETQDTVYIEVGSVVNYFNYITYSSVGNQISEEDITVISSLDTSVLGEYEVVYQMTVDSVLFQASILFIVRDQTAPSFTFVSEEERLVKLGTSAKDAMSFVLSVTDNYDSLSVSDVSVSGTVDYSEPGIYPLTYSVTDSSGNLEEETIDITIYSNDRLSQIENIDDMILLRYINLPNGDDLFSLVDGSNYLVVVFSDDLLVYQKEISINELFDVSVYSLDYLLYAVFESDGESFVVHNYMVDLDTYTETYVFDGEIESLYSSSYSDEAYYHYVIKDYNSIYGINEDFTLTPIFIDDRSEPYGTGVDTRDYYLGNEIEGELGPIVIFRAVAEEGNLLVPINIETSTLVTDPLAEPDDMILWRDYLYVIKIRDLDSLNPVELILYDEDGNMLLDQNYYQMNLANVDGVDYLHILTKTETASILKIYDQDLNLVGTYETTEDVSYAMFDDFGDAVMIIEDQQSLIGIDKFGNVTNQTYTSSIYHVSSHVNIFYDITDETYYLFMDGVWHSFSLDYAYSAARIVDNTLIFVNVDSYSTIRFGMLNLDTFDTYETSLPVGDSLRFIGKRWPNKPK